MSPCARRAATFIESQAKKVEKFRSHRKLEWVVALSYDIVADAIDKLSEDRVDVEAEKVCEND